jgi:hypothetical protein
VTLRFEIADKRANGRIAVPVQGTLEVRAEQPIENALPGHVFRRRRFRSGHRTAMARETRLCATANLPLAVRCTTPPETIVSAPLEGPMQDVVELAQLIAAKTEPSSIFALDPQPGSAEMSRQSLHRLEWGRQIGQAQARKDSESVG